MMRDMWIIATLAAAFFQCARTFQQRTLTGRLSTNGANFVRYVYGAPLALTGLALVRAISEEALPNLSGSFWLSVFLGGIAQILATSALLIAITRERFSIGTALSKTEALQAAILAALFFGEPVGLGSGLAIFAGFVGVAFLTLKSIRLHELMSRGGAYGLLCGFLFGWSSLFFREATLALASPLPLLAALVTLAATTCSQTLVLGSWLLWREPGMIPKVFHTWREATPVAVLSILGSACWFLAFTLQKAAYVRALGQTELIFTLLASVLLLREKLKLQDTLGMAILIGSIVVLLVLAR